MTNTPTRAWADRIVGSGEAPPDQFLANPFNFRIHSAIQGAALTEVLDKVGWVRRVLVNRTTGHVIDGHLRLKVADERGEPLVPYDEVELTEAEEKLVLAALDPIAGMAGTDYEVLTRLLADAPVDDGGELQKMLAELATDPKASKEPKAGQTDPDDVPAERATDIKRGDLFQLGRHLILCGDSTDVADVQRVMMGDKAVLMNTDPPYGVDYVALKKGMPGFKFSNDVKDGDIENDELTGEGLQAFLESAICAARPHLRDDAAHYYWHPMLTQGTFFAAAAAADVLIHRQIIWVKPGFVLTRSGMYHWKHELCFYGWVRGNQPPWHGDKSQTSVWEVGRDKDAGQHPTQKPVELFIRPIRNHCRDGDVIYEPFSGSGSQIIAAEQCGVSCRAIELKPEYVQVAIDRWEAFTGQTAVKIGEALPTE